MTKKHFIALADALLSMPYPPPAEMVDALARFCRAQSAQFNEARWRDYLAGKCGPCGGAVKAN